MRSKDKRIPYAFTNLAPKSRTPSTSGALDYVLDVWRTVITERPYFPEYPTPDERDFLATEEYILRFYRRGPAAHEDLVNSPRVENGGSPGATPTSDMAIQAELANLKAERDRLRREVPEKNEQLGDQHQLQKELAQVCAQLQRRDQELAQANAALERSRKRARGGLYTS
ncbi:hypothetical protein CRG98_031501 [Punica granatum]|uniref:Uncharacterized protein n=1 Tax=Punica granatum TaxID=22663 RepID=A0A2I0IVV2_PUNGR|nr:hypothetical protein CRG98_031501 [Punica granatum]